MVLSNCIILDKNCIKLYLIVSNWKQYDMNLIQYDPNFVQIELHRVGSNNMFFNTR